MFQIEFSEAAIVVVGSFNPAIFTADWLEGNGLIGNEDAQAMRDDCSLVVSHQLSRLESGWFVLQVNEDRFELIGKGASTLPLRDLAESILSLLAHTPVTALGMNFSQHYNLATEQKLHRVGDQLAPKGIWNSLFDPEVHSTGLNTLVMTIVNAPRGQVATDNHRRNITIQKSQKIRHGVLLSLNNHYDIRPQDTEDQTKAEYAAQLIRTGWESLLNESKRLCDALLTQALQ